MRSKRLVVLVTCILLVGLLAYFLRSRRHSESTDETASQPPVVSTATAQTGQIASQLTVAGIFQPFQEIDVHGKVSGYIRHIYVDIGDKVRQGQTLAVLEVPELQAQVVGAQAGIAQSQQNIARLQSEVAREESSYAAVHAAYVRLKQASDQQPGLVAAQELEDALARDKAASAQVDAAKSAVAAGQGQLGVSRAENLRVGSLVKYATITAPYTGVVTIVTTPVYGAVMVAYFTRLPTRRFSARDTPSWPCPAATADFAASTWADAALSLARASSSSWAATRPGC